jgi:hypothetical protein
MDITEKKMMISTKVILQKLAFGLAISSIAGSALAYTTKIENRTEKYIENGRVSLALCSGDDVNMKPNSSWSHGRGACLLTKITANVCSSDRAEPCVEATPYKSSGTAYEKFIIQENGKGGYLITRP